jgi:uncharacterized protein involved in tolerance to divalent cations
VFSNIAKKLVTTKLAALVNIIPQAKVILPMKRLNPNQKESIMVIKLK